MGSSKLIRIEIQSKSLFHMFGRGYVYIAKEELDKYLYLDKELKDRIEVDNKNWKLREVGNMPKARTAYYNDKILEFMSGVSEVQVEYSIKMLNNLKEYLTKYMIPTLVYEDGSEKESAVLQNKIYKYIRGKDTELLVKTGNCRNVYSNRKYKDKNRITDNRHTSLFGEAIYTLYSKSVTYADKLEDNYNNALNLSRSLVVEDVIIEMFKILLERVIKEIVSDCSVRFEVI